MNEKSKRMEPVKMVAQFKEQKSAQEFGLEQRMNQQALEKLKELIQYRVDYLDDFQRRAEKGISGAVSFPGAVLYDESTRTLKPDSLGS